MNIKDRTVVAYNSATKMLPDGSRPSYEFQGWKWMILLNKKWMYFNSNCYVTEKSAIKSGKLWLKGVGHS